VKIYLLALQPDHPSVSNALINYHFQRTARIGKVVPRHSIRIFR
jgi:hypothetical protein